MQAKITTILQYLKKHRTESLFVILLGRFWPITMIIGDTWGHGKSVGQSTTSQLRVLYICAPM